MHLSTWPAAALVLLAALGALSRSLASNARSAQAEGVRALDGVWIYVEDRTEGRALEDQQSSMGAKVTLRVDEAAVTLVRSDGEIRMALDGSPIDITREGSISRYSGAWKDGAFHYQSEPQGQPGSPSGGGIRWVLRPTADGLLASVETASGWKSSALYRHPQDIALPAPAKAAIGDLAWLSGAWVGTRGTGGSTSMEERWCPPLGGAMLAVSRTVSRDKMTAFEYLRVVERDGGLVYVAQPGGRPPTEFALTELSATRAVFENPRHDSPQRIVYELSADGGLSASIGYTKGGRPKRFDFKREGG
ncbi:MAG: hypothetical protein IT454_07330 [Planctomycetes bacterium]|nr:hypothetical protein [Planctomycetota bacterium]